MKDFKDYNLKQNNTFGMDVKCRRFIEFSTVAELQHIVNQLTDNDKPLLCIGAGSNILFTKDFDGTVLHSAIRGHHAVRVDGNVYMRCGSGETWDDVVKLCVENGLYGAENLSYIPGEVGASAVQNIGAYGVEAKDLIYKIEAVDIATGEPCEFLNTDCEYSYRWSRFKGEWRDRYIITYVTYRLSDIFVPHIEYGNIKAELDARGINTPNATQLRKVIKKIRNSKLPDPREIGNAGSFFTNPIVSKEQYDALVGKFGEIPHFPLDSDRVKIPAGWLIDKCGWKGKSMGRAGVYERQALVIVNRGDADGHDILSLSDAIRNDVKSRFGIEISPEVNII